MSGELRIAGFLVQPQLNQIRGPGGEVHLEPRTTSVLLELVARAGEVRTRDELLEAVWGDAFVGEAVLTHSIWELRKAFGDDARDPKVIQTVPRRGYRLIASVEKVSEAKGAALETLLRVELLPSEAEATPSASKRHDELVDQLLAAYSVRRAAVAGGLLVLFERPVEAVRFALAYHERLGKLAGEEPSSPSAGRVAIHLGEVRLGEGAIEGRGAEAVARLLGLAHGGQTLLTRGAFDVARQDGKYRGHLRWLAHGPHQLEGCDEVVEVCEVSVPGAAPLQPPEGASASLSGILGNTILGWRPAPGETVPGRAHWRLVTKLGEGGFGEVWLSRHDKTGDPRVFKFCFEAERLKALQREVTLFRLLKETLGDRDDIVHLLDWNFDEAPYFIELEHTSAGSLVDWAERQGGLERIPLEQRLEVIAQTADALAAAHSVGVLHKDVKPGNILIHLDHEGTAKARLGDFGIGHILDRGRLGDVGISELGETETGLTGSPAASSGTRLYMAPEMLEGRISSTEADIYALGVVLYQMAVGELERAVASGWRRQIEDEVLADDIAACVDVSPSRRPSARELAERLRGLAERRERRMREREEKAAAAADREALAEASRRRKFWTRAALVATAVLLLVSVLAFQAVRARSAAERSRLRAEDLVGYMLGDLRQTLSSVGRLDAMDGTVEKVLSYYDSHGAAELGDQDLGRHAEALRQVGEVRLQQGRLDDAQKMFGASAELAQELATRDSNNDTWQASDADSRFWLAFVRQRQGDLEAAAQGYRAHLEIYQGLVAKSPGDRKWRLEVAYGHQNLGQLDAQRGKLVEALEQHRKGRALLEGLVEEQPDDPELRAALQAFQADLQLLERLLDEAPEDTRLQERLATALSYVGSTLWMLGRPAAALESFQRQGEIRAALVELDSENADWQRYRAVARGHLGRSLGALGEVAAATRELRAASDTLEALVAGGYRSARVRRELAVLKRLEAENELAAGRRLAAFEPARRSLAVLEELLAEQGEDRAAASRLGQSYLLFGDLHAGNAGAARLAWGRCVELMGSLAETLDPIERATLARGLLSLGEVERARPIVDHLLTQGYQTPLFLEACRAHGLCDG